jgi:hypothetical protein
LLAETEYRDSQRYEKPLFLQHKCDKGERSSNPEDCVVADAVPRNRSPLQKFPFIREFNREKLDFGPSGIKGEAKPTYISASYGAIPYES